MIGFHLILTSRALLLFGCYEWPHFLSLTFQQPPKISREALWIIGLDRKLGGWLRGGRGALEGMGAAEALCCSI